MESPNNNREQEVSSFEKIEKKKKLQFSLKALLAVVMAFGAGMSIGDSIGTKKGKETGFRLGHEIGELEGKSKQMRQSKEVDADKRSLDAGLLEIKRALKEIENRVETNILNNQEQPPFLTLSHESLTALTKLLEEIATSYSDQGDIDNANGKKEDLFIFKLENELSSIERTMTSGIGDKIGAMLARGQLIGDIGGLKRLQEMRSLNGENLTQEELSAVSIQRVFEFKAFTKQYIENQKKFRESIANIKAMILDPRSGYAALSITEIIDLCDKVEENQKKIVDGMEQTLRVLGEKDTQINREINIKDLEELNDLYYKVLGLDGYLTETRKNIPPQVK